MRPEQDGALKTINEVAKSAGTILKRFKAYDDPVIPQQLQQQHQNQNQQQEDSGSGDHHTSPIKDPIYQNV